MKGCSLIPLIMIAILVNFFSKFEALASSLALNKCCNQGQYLSREGICVNKSDPSRMEPILSDSGGVSSSKWSLPNNLFYLDDSVQYNFTGDHIEIDKYEIIKCILIVLYCLQ